jgi:hypothetical protein
MPHYRVHRMKDAPRENFRWAPHIGGAAVLRARDYDAAEEMEAGNPYELWKTMADRGHSLHPGDVLERLDLENSSIEISGPLQITKYVGFEPARWFVPEPKPDSSASAAPAADTNEPAAAISQQASADCN